MQIADRALFDQGFRLPVEAVPAPGVIDRQRHAGRRARLDQPFGIGERTRDRLFNEDRLHPGLNRRQADRRVVRGRGGDADDIDAFAFEHLAVIGVELRFGQPPAFGEEVTAFLARVGACHQISARISVIDRRVTERKQQPVMGAENVILDRTADGAASDHRGAIARFNPVFHDRRSSGDVVRIILSDRTSDVGCTC